MKIIKIHYENGGSDTFLKVLDIFGRYNRPSQTAIKNLVVRLESTCLIHNIPTKTRVRPGRSTKILIGSYFFENKTGNAITLIIDYVIEIC